MSECPAGWIMVACLRDKPSFNELEARDLSIEELGLCIRHISNQILLGDITLYLRASAMEY